MPHAGSPSRSPYASEQPSASPSAVPTQETPEGTLELYLQSLRLGDETGVKAVLYPVGREFNLDALIPIDSYAIATKQVLTAADARQYDFVPAPEAGDVRLDVRQVYEAGNDEMFTYWLRQVEGMWKIYAWSSWEAPPKEPEPPLGIG